MKICSVVPFLFSGLRVSPLGQYVHGILGPPAVGQVLDVESYSLRRRLPVLLWLPGWDSRRGMLPFHSEDVTILKCNLCHMFFFSCPARKTYTNKPKERRWSKDKSPSLNLQKLAWPLHSVVCWSAVLSLLCSLFTSPFSAALPGKTSDSSPSSLYSCMQFAFLPCLVFFFTFNIILY